VCLAAPFTGFYATDARWIERTFKRWRWSYKSVKYKNPLKYTAANLRYYLQYVSNIVNYPWASLKFLDEARFDAKALQRKKGVSERGQPVLGLLRQSGEPRHIAHHLCLFCWDHVRRFARNPRAIDASLTGPFRARVHRPADLVHRHDHDVPDRGQRLGDIGAAASVQRPLGLLSLPHGPCDQRLAHQRRRFGERSAVSCMLLMSFSIPVHPQVMDNAPVHVARDMLNVLDAVLDLAGVRLFFLPKYSPELNPCEMVFAQVRCFARLLLRMVPLSRVCSLLSYRAGEALSA
jgi:hypothetical protein